MAAMGGPPPPLPGGAPSMAPSMPPSMPNGMMPMHPAGPHDVPGGYKAQRVRTGLGTRPVPYDPNRDKPHTSNHAAAAAAAAGAADGGVSEADIMFASPTNSYKVGATTDVRELASTITQACQMSAGDLPALLTIGNASINQAVKGIAVAAAELRLIGDLTFQPAFRHPNRTKPLIAFYLSRQRMGPRVDNGEVVELTATGNQKIISLAGAIAGKVREGKRTHIIAIGAEAVTSAVLAIGNARLFLERDSLDIQIAPEFVKVNKNNTPMNALKLNIVPAPIPSGGAAPPQ